MKSVETQLQEAQTQIGTLAKENTELKTKFEEAQTTAAKATVVAELTKLLTESKLPAVSQERIRKQFAEAVKVDGIAEAIKQEAEYVKQLGGTAIKKNLGASDNGTTREADQGAKPNLEEAFKSCPACPKQTQSSQQLCKKFRTRNFQIARPGPGRLAPGQRRNRTMKTFT